MVVSEARELEEAEVASASPRVDLTWRTPVGDEELVELDRALGADPSAGWWEQVRPYLLGWATARDEHGALVGFVNLAWDGARHAFLLDPKVAPTHQRHGLGTGLVALATDAARAAGCQWLHVDYEPHLAGFYEHACGFTSTHAGLILLAADTP